MERYTPPDTHFSAAPIERAVGAVMPDYHAHEAHEINVVFRGRGYYRIPGQASLDLAGGEILILPGGLPHRLFVTERLSMLLLLLHPDLIPGLPIYDPGDSVLRRLASFRDPLPARSVVNPEAARILTEIAEHALHELSEEREWSVECQTSLASLAGIHLARLMREAQSAPPDPASARVLQVKVWMDRNFHQEVRLGELSARAHLSPSQFSLRFRALADCAPMQYLKKRRLDHAARLLAHSGLSVLDISLSAGFRHLAHFNRSFKQSFGMPPSAYRKKHQKIRKKQ